MKRTSIVLSIFLCGFVQCMLIAQNRAKPMTNDDVVAMVKAGLPEATILNAIDAQETSFDNSAAALVDLSKQGVSAKVLDVMIAAAKKQREATPAAPASTPPAAVPAGQQFAGQPPATPKDSTVQPKSGGTSNAPSQNGFFGRLGDVQNQVNGAVKQGQGTVQQGETAVRQVQGTGQTSPASGPANAQAKPSAAVGQPNAAPAATLPGTASSPAVTAQAQQAQRAAAIQQQRLQQTAARQKLTEQMNACKQQATSIDPQMRSPESQKAYSACVQTAVQASVQANTQATEAKTK